VIDAIAFAFFKSSDEPKCAVFDMDPVADLLTGAVDWDVFIAESFFDNEGDELLGVLTRAVIVGASGYDDILAVGDVRSLGP